MADEENALDVAVATDVGKVRERQEDAYLCAPERALLVVADGMGGHVAGDVASAMTVAKLDADLSADALSDSADIAVTIAEALQAAQDAVLEDERRNPERNGMGTTCVVVHLAPGSRTATVANLGDSRCYVLRDGTLTQVTTDHVVSGAFGRSLTQAIGSPDGIRPELLELDLETGDRLVLCTDGLSDMVTDGEIASIAQAHGGAQELADALVQAALAAGGRDNVTVLVALVD